MNSNQEKNIHTLFQRSLGAPFIFAPDEYKKGSATREPADLVWACNNCIILFYMKSKKNESKEVNVVKGRKEKLIVDNFNQAKGWLSEWESGRKLIGKNIFKRFNIAFGEYKHIVIIGIIDYNNEEGFYHDDYEKELKVKLCATISQKTFELLVNLDFTAIDIISLIKRLKGENLGSKPSGSLAIANEYYAYAHKYAYDSAKSLLPEILPQQELINNVSKLFQALRSALLLEIKRDDKEIYSVASIFNDIPLHHYYQLIILLAHWIKFQEKDLRIWTVYVQDLENYIFIIGVARAGNFHLLSEKQLEAERMLEKSNRQNTLVSIAFETYTYASVFAFKERPSKSQCEKLLEGN